MACSRIFFSLDRKHFSTYILLITFSRPKTPAIFDSTACRDRKRQRSARDERIRVIPFERLQARKGNQPENENKPRGPAHYTGMKCCREDRSGPNFTYPHPRLPIYLNDRPVAFPFKSSNQKDSHSPSISLGDPLFLSVFLSRSTSVSRIEIRSV